MIAYATAMLCWDMVQSSLVSYLKVRTQTEGSCWGLLCGDAT